MGSVPLDCPTIGLQAQAHFHFIFVQCMKELCDLLDSSGMQICALFVWLISHQPAVLFSQNKPATSTFLSEQISISHQPNERAAVFSYAIQEK
jgi:hypothetical protein